MSLKAENRELVSRIQTACKSIGITVKSLESELGFPNGTIGKWASAAKRPPFERINAVANYFGYTVSFLLGASGQPTPLEGSGLSTRGYLAASLFDQAEPWLQDQILALLKAAESAREARGEDSKAE